MIINAGTVKVETPYVAKIGSIWQEPGKMSHLNYTHISQSPIMYMCKPRLLGGGERKSMVHTVRVYYACA